MRVLLQITERLAKYKRHFATIAHLNAKKSSCGELTIYEFRLDAGIILLKHLT